MQFEIRRLFACNGQITRGFATLQYPYPTLGSLHVPVLLLRLRLTLAGTRRKPTTLGDIATFWREYEYITA
jgi:hypothetical protein